MQISKMHDTMNPMYSPSASRVQYYFGFISSFVKWGERAR